MPKCSNCNKRYVHEKCFYCEPLGLPSLVWESAKIEAPWWTDDWDQTLPEDCPSLGFSHEGVWCHEPCTDMQYMYGRLRPDQICKEYGFEEVDLGGGTTALVKKELEDGGENGGIYILTGINEYADLPPDGTGFHLQYEPTPGSVLWRYWYDYIAGEGEVHWRGKKKLELELDSVCNDCGSEFVHQDLEPIKHLHSRVLPGDVMPVGQCPECGGTCRSMDEETTVVIDLTSPVHVAEGSIEEGEMVKKEHEDMNREANPRELAEVAMDEMNLQELTFLSQAVNGRIRAIAEEAKLTDRIECAAEDANIAFWAVVAKQFPEITSGDCYPDMHMEIDEKTKEWIRWWVETNSEEEK
jgi:hypothetical protein